MRELQPSERSLVSGGFRNIHGDPDPEGGGGGGGYVPVTDNLSVGFDSEDDDILVRGHVDTAQKGSELDFIPR